MNNDGDEYLPPFGEDNLYEAIDVILNGKPTNFDPFNTDEMIEYTDEQKAEWDKLYSELPTALDLVLVDEIGERIAYSVIDFFENQENKINK